MSENNAPREWWRDSAELLGFAAATCLRAMLPLSIWTFVGGVIAALIFSIFRGGCNEMLAISWLWFAGYVVSGGVLLLVWKGECSMLNEYSLSERDAIRSLQQLTGEQRVTITQTRQSSLRMVLAALDHVRECRLRQDGASNTHRIVSRRFVEDQIVELCRNDPSLLGAHEVFDTLSHPDFHDMLRRHRHFFRTTEKGRALLAVMKSETGN